MEDASILPTSTVERSISSQRLVLFTTYLRNRTTEDGLNGFSICATESIDVNRVIDRFANEEETFIVTLKSVC